MKHLDNYCSLLLNGNHVTLRPSAPCHLIYDTRLSLLYK